jgi:outer membrane protein assembly factor BamB
MKATWLLAATSLLLGVLLLPAQAREWTRFRGPNGTGVHPSARGLPTEYQAAAANWRVPLPGTGHSSPVVWENRVFITSAEEEAGKQHLLCLDAANGRVLWTRTNRFEPYPRHSFNSFASSTPAVDSEQLYVSWLTPEAFTVHAYDHEGRERWKRDLGRYEVNHGGSASPILFEDLVIIRSDSDRDGPESFVMALDRATGATRWRTTQSSTSGSYSTPLLMERPGRPTEMILTSNAHGFTSVNPRDGKVLWEVKGTFPQRCVASPVVAGELIFATCGDGAGQRHGVAVRAGRQGPEAVAYTVPRGVPYVPTPVVYQGLLFLWGDGGVVTCVRADSGEQVWMERVGGNYFGSPVCADGKLYAISTRGELVVIAASEKFQVLGRSELGEGSHATPAIAANTLYLRTESHLISLGGAANARQ